MKAVGKVRTVLITLILVGLGGSVALWLGSSPERTIEGRVPIPENEPGSHATVEKSPNPGALHRGAGKPSAEKGSWSGFRGDRRDAIADGTPISPWGGEGPKVLWKLEVGEGHAGVAVRNGRVYILDYDEEKREDALRCLSLENAEEIWRYSYYVKVKRNHGMSRTVPAVTDRFVVTLGPKCHLLCVDAITGKLKWKKDLVREYGTKVPEWYAGECPLIDNGKVIIGTGGRCIMTAIDLETGETTWETPNEDGWQMTHSSVMPIEINGRRQYVWCTTGGVVGVESGTGKILWKFPEWRIRIATVPSPLYLGDGLIFLTGGYNAGGMMVRITEDSGSFELKTLFRTKSEVFSSLQQTPIFYKGLIYAVVPGGKLACMTPEGKVLWSENGYDFGLGPYLIVDGKLLVLDDNPPMLYLFDVGSTGARELAKYKLSSGHEAWAPIAFVNGKVILRDSKTLFCLELR